LVVSHGGGALVNAEGRQAFEASSTVVCLHAAEEVLVSGLAAATDRPLVARGSSRTQAAGAQSAGPAAPGLRPRSPTR
jgi:shikimate kinase